MMLQSLNMLTLSFVQGAAFEEACAVQASVHDATGTKVAAELAEAKKKFMQKIMSWNLPDAKAKDIIFLVHSQLRRKVKRLQAFYGLPVPLC